MTWFDTDTPLANLHVLLKPYPAELMDVSAASALVNSPKERRATTPRPRRVSRATPAGHKPRPTADVPLRGRNTTRPAPPSRQNPEIRFASRV